MSARSICTLLVALCALAWSPVSQGLAGDGECIPVVVNMTPDGSDDAARECATELRRALRSSVGDFDALGESRMRTLLQRGEYRTADDSDFFAWSDDALDAAALAVYASEAGAAGGSIVLFDCRPTDAIFRALVVPVGPGNVRATLRGPLMNVQSAVATLNELIQYQAIGWQP